MKSAVSSFFCAQIVVGAERIKYVKNSADEIIKEWNMI